jgi:MoaA/NifB/PqqE/SkfB family radical SAM enzyme
MKKNEPIICLTALCGQKCLYCSRANEDPTDSPGRIRRLIRTFKDSICVEGGEPVMAADLLKWVRYAKAQGTRDIILVTNGFNLDKADLVRSLLDAGVTMFNVQLPAHNARLFDLVTQTKGNFKSRLAAIKNLMAVAGPSRVRLTHVVNSVTCRFLPQYAKFLADNFGGILYVELNMVKVLGSVEKRTWLLPRFGALKPKLLKAFSVLDGRGVPFLTDGFPLCVIAGYEDRSIDTFKLAHRSGALYLGEKTLGGECAKCSLKRICPGIRSDYAKLFGTGELKASAKDPRPIIKLAAHQLKRRPRRPA